MKRNNFIDNTRLEKQKGENPNKNLSTVMKRGEHLHQKTTKKTIQKNDQKHYQIRKWYYQTNKKKRKTNKC